MTDLSPAAQAVLDAFICTPIEFSDTKALAAALRATADQLTPYSVEYMSGAAFCRNKILAIATELEAQ